MTDKGEKRKKIDGKAFMKSLMDCNNSKEVFDLLGQTLGSERMKDRAKNISDLPAIVKLNAVKAKINLRSFVSGYYVIWRKMFQNCSKCFKNKQRKSWKLKILLFSQFFLCKSLLVQIFALPLHSLSGSNAANALPKHDDP